METTLQVWMSGFKQVLPHRNQLQQNNYQIRPNTTEIVTSKVHFIHL